MAKVFTVHSFLLGTGRSTIVSRLAVALALDGFRVGLFEADLLRPSLCPLFGLPDDTQARTVNHYLRGECTIGEAAVDLTHRLGLVGGGRLVIVPASVSEPDLLKLLRESFDAHLLSDAFAAFSAEFQLDILLVDAPAGENEASLVTTAICDTLLVVLRLDEVDYLGSGIVVDVARRLDAPSILLVANRVPDRYDLEYVRSRLIEVFECDVGAVIPESSWMTGRDTPLIDLFTSQDPAALAIEGLAKRIARPR